MKAIRLLAVVLFVIAGGLFLADQNQAMAQEFDKEEAKGPWILHSMDSVVTGDPICTEWLQILLYVRSDGSTFSCWNDYHCYDWVDNGDGVLSHCDQLFLAWETVAGEPRRDTTCYKMHVSEVTVTLDLRGPLPDKPDTKYVEYSGGGETLHPDSLNRALSDPVCTYWHEVWPEFCPWWHIHSWHDNTNGELDSCDTVDIVPVEKWHVVAVEKGDETISLALEGMDEQMETMIVEYSTEGAQAKIDRALQDPVCTYWHEESPEYCNWWHIIYWKDNTSGQLDSCDTVIVEPIEIWHVIGLVPLGPDSFELVIEDGGESKILTGTRIDPVVCSYWHEEEPEYCNWWHVIDWWDNTSGVLDPCDTLIVVPVEFWHVNGVGTDITLDSHSPIHCPDPTPTTTQWGLIILVALIIASAVFVGLKRRKSAVPA